MHPLPRLNEISEIVDKSVHAKYFEQAKNGLWVRVALIAIMFNVDKLILSKKI